MPRIAGIDVPDNKPLRISLTYLYGIGPVFAEKIIAEAALDGQMRARDLSEDDIAKINGIIEGGFVIEGALRRQTAQHIQRLRDIRCYRGDRHRHGLPCRGQRTQTNARTRKGRKKTVAGKKSVKSMK